MYSEETLRAIEQRYEREFAILRQRRSAILRVEQTTPNGVIALLAIQGVVETPDGLIIRVV